MELDSLDINKYEVSVIVPIYNAEKTLKECLNSLINQTLQSLEIILINDGSTDNSKKIIDEYKRNYPNIVVINQKNHGLYYSRKRGLEIAHGQYIGWVDSDDFVDKTMYAKMYNLAVSNNSELVYCDYEFFPHKSKMKEKWVRIFNGKKDVDFVERNSQPWNKIVKRNLLEDLNIGDLFESCFDEAYIKVLLKAKRPIFCKDKLYYYRISDGSMSSNYTNLEHYINFISSSRALKSEINKKENLNQYWQDYFDYRIIYYSILSMLISANIDNKSKYIELKRNLNKNFPKYYLNQHFRHILFKNFGFLKGTVIGYIIPKSYTFAKTVCKVAL